MRNTENKSINIKVILLLLVLLYISESCRTLRFDNRIARDRNVCKKLHGRVLLYGIFVDNDNTKPWTDFDLSTTISSVNQSMNWIEAQAPDSLNLKIDFKYFQYDTINTIEQKLPKKTVFESVFFGKNPIGSLNRWGDKIASIAHAIEISNGHIDSLTIDKKFTKERLIAELRDKYKVESVALVYFVNNYYIDDISVTVNSALSNDIEYTIVSYKRPSVITHEFLHLFGASDLYRQMLNKKKKIRRLSMKYFPNDIMQAVYHRDLDELEIGDLTKYLIGWTDTYDPKWESLFYEVFKLRFRLKRKIKIKMRTN